MKIKVDEGFCNAIQAACFEVDARKSIITFMLSTGMDISTEQFKKYQDEYNEFFVKAEMLKAQLENQYIKPLYDGKDYSWVLDYSTCEVTVSER